MLIIIIILGIFANKSHTYIYVQVVDVDIMDRSMRNGQNVPYVTLI